jgi:hypothetical protein
MIDDLGERTLACCGRRARQRAQIIDYRSSIIDNRK